ncbi:Small-conductance mechanosensitive channel [Shimia gijangensis]|uniref:Small-conductance mechanosensitive channel n=1 Tax=Shimia gijangensis TaxID=1470563 RepID=A0A1M6JRM0_9RHOB|nr:mechanosensitive ion channel family protein [Shimia gijangensis]SHJ49302.1 Small-conductance mechanosensitive channel [Shimia gijangensis]
MYLTRLIATLVFVTTLFLSPLQGIAQDDGAASTETFAEIMKEAAQSGVSVIVMDPGGNVLGAAQGNQPPEEILEPEAASERMSSLMKVQTKIDGFRQILQQRLDALPAAINEVEFILRASSPTGQISAFFKTLLWTLGLLAVGHLFEREIFGKRFARNYVVSRVKENPQGYSEKLPFLAFRFVAGTVGICISILVAIIISAMLFGISDDTAIEFTYYTITTAYFAVRMVSLVWRMILSPYLEQYRIPAFSTPDAKRLHNWLFFVATLDVCTAMFGTWLNELGLNYDVYAVMVVALTTLFAMLNIAMVLVNRRSISAAIRKGREVTQVTLATRLASQLWAPVMIVYMIFGWMQMSYQLMMNVPATIPLIAGAYIIFTSIIVVYATINFGIERYFDRARSIQEMNDAAEEAAQALAAGHEITDEEASVLGEVLDESSARRLNTFEDLARRISGILAMVAGLFACMRIWGGEGMLTSDGFIGRGQDVIVIMFIGYIFYNAFRIWIDSKIREEQGEMSGEEGELGDEGGANGASRLATLLPLFRNFILIIILVTIGLIVLLEMGVNVSPLFAGAGVVGLAIGFGAQTLVRDIFSGAFFLFDDAFRKGEYIDIGGVKGTVEKISVRSFQLRHHLGPLHTVPFGEIQFLTNYSRDWVIMKLPLRVTYDTDVEKVRKLIKKLGVELLDDPVIGDNFIQPLKSQGVIQMEDSAMIIRVKFMTKPGDQWLVRKKVFEEIRSLFEREDIHFAHRQVTVRLADEDSDKLTPKQREAVAGAVLGAIEEEMEDEGGGDDR